MVEQDKIELTKDVDPRAFLEDLRPRLEAKGIKLVPDPMADLEGPATCLNFEVQNMNSEKLGILHFVFEEKNWNVITRDNLMGTVITGHVLAALGSDKIIYLRTDEDRASGNKRAIVLI